MKIELEMYPISVNRIYRCVPGKGLMLSKAGRQWYLDAQQELMLTKQLPEKMLEAPLGCALELFPPDARVRDIDNPLKVIFDLLQKANYIKNDSQIKTLGVEMHLPQAWSGFKLRLWEL